MTVPYENKYAFARESAIILLAFTQNGWKLVSIEKLIYRFIEVLFTVAITLNESV